MIVADVGRAVLLGSIPVASCSVPWASPSSTS